MTLRSKRLFMSSIFFIRWASTKGPFLIDRLISSSSLVAAAHDHLVRARVVARLVSLRRRAPRRHRVPAAGGLPLTPAVRMIHGVHRHAAVDWLPAHPPLAPRLADRNVLVVQISHLADGGVAVHVHAAHL